MRSIIMARTAASCLIVMLLFWPFVDRPALAQASANQLPIAVVDVQDSNGVSVSPISDYV